MGFGSFFKGLGKGLLKAAPIAASFIPGVGIPAAMGIGALSKGLSNKFSGGSFLGGAASGAAEGAVGGLAKKAMFGGFGKGIGASKNLWGKIGRGTLGAATGRPISRGYGMPQYPYSTPPFYGGNSGSMYGQGAPLRRSYTQQQLNPFAQSVANNSRNFTMGGY